LSLRKLMASGLRLGAGWTPFSPTFATRLGVANSLLIAFICIIQSWVLAWCYLGHVRGLLTERGHSISAHLARESGHLIGGNLDPLRALAQQALVQGGVAYIRFFDARGLMLVSAGQTPVEAAFTAPGAVPEGQGPISVGGELWEFQAPILASDLRPAGGQRSSPAVPAGPAQPDAHARVGTVAVGVSLESLRALRSRTLGTAVLLTSLFMLGAVLAAVRLARAITRPLGALATAVDTVARGDFSVRVEVRTNDEIGRLALSFNTMVDNLARSATLEEKMRELEEVARLKSEFLATISHELRTPLNVIIGYAEMLTAGAAGAVTVQQAEMLETIRRYSKLQLDLITNVLDFSRLASGKVSFHIERFALAPLLAEIEVLHRGRLRNQSLSVTVSVDPEVPELETDRVKLHEIVRNLVDNALKFTEAGSVSIRARPAASAASVVIEVMDTGPGIHRKDLDRIFDAFQQAGRTSSRDTRGVGLGLSIVKQLVDALGGTVSVASRVGEGSTFRVEIPHALAARHESPTDAPRALTALDDVARNAATPPAAGRPFRPLRRRARPAHLVDPVD